MSGEQITAKDLNRAEENNFSNNSKTKKVDINHLLQKIRVEKKKEKKENFVFLSLVVGVLAVTGIIASL